MDPLPTEPGIPFQAAARLSLEDVQLRRNMGKATTTIRRKRAKVVEELPDWEHLREAGRAIKDRTLRHLDTYLLQLEASVTRAGGVVHWAADAAEANAIIGGLVARHGAREVVKIKSLTTDEIGLNEALEKIGVEATETDLAELIIQLAGERSSHILVPAIHKNRSEIRALFRKRLAGTENLTDEPKDLAAAARAHLRRKFLTAKVAVSGANFGVAETGTICIVESEGNGRMCLTLPKVLISVMGIEKTIPTWRDLEVFLQLLPRSSTAERMNPYTSFWTGVSPGDGPEEFHLILLDNGRTKVLADAAGRQTLQCIRCSACLNICPVYERTGGHAYTSVYPGPIGAILTPQLVGVENASSLPFASSLCGACYEVCPVKINIPEVLLHLRGEVVRHKQDNHLMPSGESIAMKSLGRVFASPGLFERAQRMGRFGQRFMLKGGVITSLPGQLGGWTTVRDVFPVADQTFREWWRARKKPAAPSSPKSDSPKGGDS
ncbi:LutB/LldF family L-lactate oxidation iron-sulfur protein [Aquisphaera insulae]|uniref:LutB/LldF family L-lactate oxidation iron-sulfur protein n=1 Tax=Aquisphaera insulae TaxID=2712864 RepID=UPI0034E28139